MNEVSGPIKGRDLEMDKKTKEAILNPKNLSTETVADLVKICIKRIERLRMGGRSSSLLALCSLLWHRSSDISIDGNDVEKLFCTGFHIAGDPSYVHPSAGILLAGILIAKYSNKIPKNSREEILRQACIMLEHIEQSTSYQNSVKACASYILDAWNINFKKGLTDAANTLRNAWKDTRSISSIPKRTLEKEIEKMENMLPSSISDRQRRYYRLYKELKERWLIDNLSFDK